MFKWSEVHGLLAEQFEDLVYFIGQMDEVWQKHSQKKFKAELTKNKPAPPKPATRKK